MRYKVGDKVKLSAKILSRTDDVRVQDAHILTIEEVYERDGIYGVAENSYWYADWMLADMGRDLMLTREGMAVFAVGAISGMFLTILGVWLALKCLEWRGLW